MKHTRPASRLLPALALSALNLDASEAADRIELSGDGIAPESITSSVRGTIFIGSATRSIYRAEKDATIAKPWAEAPTDGPRSIFGVFVDEQARTLWACTGSVPATISELQAYELESGALKARYPLPTPGGICNDIAVAADGTVFATDSINMQVLRLRKGGHTLEIWAGAARESFGPVNGIIDGIAVLESRVIVNTLVTRKLFGIPIGRNGEAGKIVEIELDRPLAGPDGMRASGRDAVVVAETADRGAVSRVTIRGQRGAVQTLREGFAQGAVAVTLQGDVLQVLGNKPIVANDGSSPRFEVVGVKLPR